MDSCVLIAVLTVKTSISMASSLTGLSRLIGPGTVVEETTLSMTGDVGRFWPGCHYRQRRADVSIK
jgi:hypothetical protein